MIGRIRVVLSFEAESGPEIVGRADLSVGGAIQEVPAVELDCGFGGPNFEYAASRRFAHTCCG